MEHYKPLVSSFKDDTIRIATAWQQEMHKFVEATLASSPKVSYQDATNVFLLLKMAEMEAVRRNELTVEGILNKFNNQS